MLLDAQRACLLIVDLQERLLKALHRPEGLLANNRWLLAIAQRLDVPVLLSEQYPRGLGPTAGTIRQAVPPQAILEKTCFSLAHEPAALARLDALDRNQLVITGAEAHVCVLQTALGLLAGGREVYVVADCVASRDPANAELALARLRQEGVRVVSREMVAYEWLHQAGTERFRAISREFLRNP